MRLLLVEDDDLLATSIKQDLEQQGFAVDHAREGVEAEFMGDNMTYDLVVLDLGLPNRPGLEVLKNWRAR
ncbi:MAG: response regulator, partial [Candidatus Thiodiazotropha sp.]